MKKAITLCLVTSALLLPLQEAGATLSLWQVQVYAGSFPAATIFTEVSAPILTNIGTLTGGRAFEFIVNANPSTTGSVSSALLGTQSVENGRQGLKYEQYNDTGNLGMTAFGVADYETTIAAPISTNTQVVFTSDGIKTDLYLNGVFQTSFAAALALTGEQGLGAAYAPATSAFFDILPGKILGFASYDSDLGAAEILTHYNAFVAVPEAGSSVLFLTGIAGLALRRRR